MMRLGKYDISILLSKEKRNPHSKALKGILFKVA
jgi:hypothetical protein